MQFQNHAKNLVSADRAAMFLVDRLANELYARIFDKGVEGKDPGLLEVGNSDIRCVRKTRCRILNIVQVFEQLKFKRL